MNSFEPMTLKKPRLKRRSRSDEVIHITNLNNRTISTSGGASYYSGNYYGWEIEYIAIRSGNSSGKYTLKYSNAGYTTDGTPIDLVIDITSTLSSTCDYNYLVFITRWGHDGDGCASFYSAYHTDRTLYGVSSDTTYHIYKAGTTTPIDGKFVVAFWDLDQPGMPGDSSGYGNIYTEGLEVISGYTGDFYTGNTPSNHSGSPMHNSTRNGHPWIYASHDCAGASTEDDRPDSGLVFTGTNGLRYIWRGYGCGSSMVLDASPTTYPSLSTPTKSPETQVRKKGATCTDFTITQKFPYVCADNKPSKIVVSDTFDSMLDLSSVSASTVQVFQGSTDVTSKWTYAKSGQTITFTAKNTAHGGGAEGTLKFVIKNVKVKNQNPGASYSKTSDGKYWIVNNKATTSVTATLGGGTKTTNTVAVHIPIPVKIVYNYTGDYSPSSPPALPTVANDTYYMGDSYSEAAGVTDSSGNYDFDGWYTSSACTTRWGTSRTLTSEVTNLYGRWIPRPKVTPAKSVSPAKVNINETATYTITATQTVQGASTSSITLTDKLNQSGDIIGDGASYVTDSIVIKNNAGTNITSSCTINWASNGKSFTATIPTTLTYNQKVTLTYKVKAGNTTTTALQGKSYTNRVTAKCANQAKPQADSPLTADATLYVRKPALTVTKSASDTFVDVGDTVTYTLTAKNSGEADSIAYNVKFKDVFDSNVLFANGGTITSVVVKDGSGSTVDATYTLGSDNKTITITPSSRLDLASGKSATATVKIKFGTRSSKALSGRVYKNTVTASSNNTDNATANAQVETSEPKLSITKTAVDPKLNVSESGLLRVVAKNTTNGSKAYNVSVTDTMEAATVERGGYIDASTIKVLNNAGTNITSSCTITTTKTNGKVSGFKVATTEALGYNETITVEYKEVAGTTTSVDLQAKNMVNSVYAEATNANDPSNTATAKIYVRKPALATTKTVDDNYVDAGDTVTYTLTAKNTGEADSIAYNVKFKDVYENNILFANGATVTSVVVKNASGTTVEATHAVNSDNKTITITPSSRLDIPAGKSVTATLKIKLGNRSSSVLSGKVYKNTLTTSTDNTDNATDNEQIEISDPKLSTTKTALDPKLNVSESGKLRVETKNTTQGSKAYNVSITDTMEAATVERGGYIDASTIKVFNNAGADITSAATITTTKTDGKVSAFKVATTEVLAYNEKIAVEYKEVAGTTTSVALQTKNMVNSVYSEASNATEPSNTATAKIYVREPKMNAAKSVNDTYVDAGDTVFYTLTATNSGGDADSIIWNVVLTDAFPAQLIADGAIVDIPNIVVKDHNNATVQCSPVMNGNNLVIATDVDLPDTKTMTATVPVILGDRGNIMSGRTYENILTNSSDNSNEATAKARIEVSDPVLKTTKVATEDAVNTSERCHFTVTGTNTTEGSVAYNISFTDRLTDSAASAGAWIDLDTLQFVMPGGSVLARSEYTLTPVKKQGRVVGFDIQSSRTLAYNEVMTITYDVVAGETTSIDLQDTSIPNTARVNASNSKNPGNQASDTVEVYTPELTIIKETTMPVANVADHVPYKITVEQVVEGAIAWNIHLVDDIQEDFAALGGTWDLGSFHVLDASNVDRVSECGFYTNADKSRLDISTPVSLGYHEKMTVLYEVVFGETTTREMQGNDYTNIVTASADNTRKDVSDDATVHVPVPHAKATKTVDKPVVNVTDKVVYTLVAENDGEEGSCLRNVTFTDVMPAKMIAAGAVIDTANITATQGGLPLAITPVVDGNTITIETGQSLYTGDNITVLIPVTVGNRASWELCGATWQNELTVSSDNADPAKDTEEVTVLKPDLEIVKTPGVEIANVSDRIDYTIVATNKAEGSLAFDPTITDELAELAVAEHAYIDQSTIKIEHSNGTNLTGAATITWKLNEEGQAIGYTAFVPCDISDADSLTITYTAVSGKTTSQELMKEGMDNEVEGILANDPDPRDDTATVAFYTPVLEIIKTADAKYLNAGDTAGYTLVVHQLEEGAIAWNVVIEDALSQESFDRGAYMLAESWKLFYDGEEVDPENLEWIDFSEADVEPSGEGDATEPADDEPSGSDENGKTDDEQNGGEVLSADSADAGQADQNAEPAGDVTDPDQEAEPAEGAKPDEEEAVVPDSPEKRARGFVTETGIDLAKDHEIKITYDVKAGAYDVNALSGTDIENIARATGDNVPVPAEDVNVIPVLFPHLAVEKTADRHQISTYEEIEYQVAAEVTEENAIAHDVVFDDTFIWAGAEGAVDADKIADSVVVDLDGKALELDEEAISVEGDWQNDEGTIKIHVETASELPYGSVMTMTYNVMFGEREAEAPVLAQVVDNLATVSCSNGDQAQDDEQIEILDAELTIDKRGISQSPDSISYEVEVFQVKENAIARDVVINDRLSDGAVVSGVSLNKDVVVFNAAGQVVEAKVTYIENGPQVIGYTVEVGDLAFNEGVKVAYTSNAATLGFGFTEVVNTATASALNAAEVADTEAFAFDGGVAPDLIQTGDGQDPFVLIGFITATAAVAASASVARRRRG